MSPPSAGVRLMGTADGLELRVEGQPGAVRLDVATVERRARQGRRLALARACGVRPGLRVLDALAGWGTDGLTLARLGCAVTCCETSPLVFEMLKDRVRRFTEAGLGTAACARCDGRSRFPEDFDVIYLDPMFGVHPKTALPDRSMQVLADLASAVELADLAAMVEAARGAAAERVVVKRRRRAPALETPTWQILGKTVRFDVYTSY